MRNGWMKNRRSGSPLHCVYGVHLHLLIQSRVTPASGLLVEAVSYCRDSEGFARQIKELFEMPEMS
jgi:hypothetical protein